MADGKHRMPVLRRVNEIGARVSIALIALSISVVSRVETVGDEIELLKTDSRSRYVHRISLYDEDGAVIDPSDPQAAPYSPSQTCGKCHPYGKIHTGWHFNAADKDVRHGRPGEPWILVDEPTGTQIPVTYRDWPNAFKPEEVGLSNWKFILEFGRHMPGNGVGEKRDEEKEDVLSRWMITGNLEMDCLLCHSADQQHDPAEWGVQVSNQNFKWAPTAAADFAMIRGDTKALPEDFDPYAPPNPDFPEQRLPQVVYHKATFDGNDRYQFNVNRHPPNTRCYYCHTAVTGGPDTTNHWKADTDVHISAGLSCADCHRHGIDHAVNRGIEGDEATPAALSCRGCHLGEEGATSGTELGGRFASPRPEHKGLPAVHLEKMTCTSCHSGPWPQETPGTVMTSFAHQLGIPTRHRQEIPYIAANVFLRNDSGKIAPHRVVWPAYFGILKDEELRPLPIDDVKAAGEGIVKTKHSVREKAELPKPEQIAAIIEKLSQSVEDGEVVYVAGGKVHKAAADGKISSTTHSAAAPYTWQFAHDVRPGAQSLGVNGCTDCHAADKPIYYGTVTALSPVKELDTTSHKMYELRDEDPKLVEAWTISFQARDLFFYLASAAVFVTTALVLLFLFKGLAALTRRLGK